MSTESNHAVRFLEKYTGGAITLGRLLKAIRQGEELSLSEFSRKLRISRQHLCDIEKARKFLSPARAARFAKLLGLSESRFVQLALQSQVDQAGLKYRVELESA